MSNESDTEKLVSNFEKFKSYASKTGDRADALLALINDFEERLCVAPALSSNQFEQSAPGGLIDHSLRVLLNFKKLTELYNVPVSLETLIIVSLFHDIGKLGTREHELFILETDAWRRERYGNYKINENVPYMSMPCRSIFLLQEYGVRLSLEEFQCILLSDGMYSDANRNYAGHESRLVLLFHQAEINATRQGKIVKK